MASCSCKLRAAAMVASIFFLALLLSPPCTIPSHLQPRRITSLGERDHDRDGDFSSSCAAGFLRIATPPSSSPRLPPAHPAALFLHLAAQPLCALPPPHGAAARLRGKVEEEGSRVGRREARGRRRRGSDAEETSGAARGEIAVAVVFALAQRRDAARLLVGWAGLDTPSISMDENAPR
ncbi:hypothetical protein E2562_031621 [Oryza meyeriana var. granulata]|uniref:Uncharacterized protein n=1 Tax=Oryza meyeriana var. granulata TaxID=110450 RepID=A0A6G1D8M9_9ORYZ|nr:hypothetical protein E2562_031621 [Oryza meyeriana var. granulata]